MRVHIHPAKLRQISQYLRQLEPKHGIAVIVAIALPALALADGGTDPVAYSITAAALWLAVLAGLASGVLPRAPIGRAPRAAAAALAALALITGLSGLWASDPGSAYDEAVVALAYAGLFALILVAARRGEARAWLAGLAIGLSLIAVLALGARLEPALFGAGERDLISRLPASEGRLSDPFTYWNALAASQAAAVVLLAAFASAAGSRRMRALAVGAIPLSVLVLYLSTSRGGAGAAALGLLVLIAVANERLRALAGLAVGFLGGAALIAFAGGRAELLDHPLTALARSQAGGLELAIVLAVLACALTAYWLDPALERLRGMRVSIPRAGWRGIALAGLVAVVVGAVVADPKQGWEDFKQPPEAPVAGEARDLLGRSGSSGRYQFWSAAIDAFEANPGRGVGAAGFEYYWNRNGSLGIPGPNGHSLLLDTAAELGLLGLAALLGFLAISLRLAWRRVRGRGESDADPPPDRDAVAAAAALLVSGLAYASIDFIWENPVAFAPLVIAAALLAGPASAPASETPRPAAGERRSRRSFAGGVFVIGFAWIGICASVLLVVTSLQLSSSRAALERGEGGGAAQAAGDAIDLEPWAAEPRLQLALVLESEGDVEEARAEIAEAIDRSPEDWRLRLVAARLDLAAGDPDAARAAALEARALAPRLSIFDPPIEDVLAGL